MLEQHEEPGSGEVGAQGSGWTCGEGMKYERTDIHAELGGRDAVVVEGGAASQPGVGGDADGQRVQRVRGYLPRVGPDIFHGPPGGGAGDLPSPRWDHALL